jgi:hypothetical protein
VRKVAGLAVDPGRDDRAAVGLERLTGRRAGRDHTLGSGEGDA